MTVVNTLEMKSTEVQTDQTTTVTCEACAGLSPTVKSCEFYLHDDVTFPAKWLTFVEKNRGVKFVLVTSSRER